LSGERFTVDRRVTLQWLFGAMAAGTLPGCATDGIVPTAAEGQEDWPDVAGPPVTAKGYGTDPAMLEGAVSWPRTLDADQRATAAALADTILPPEGDHPAPSAIGIEQFIDEWVSAPYSEQAADRTILLNGFAWVEREAMARHGRPYAALDAGARAAVLRDAAASGPKGAGFLQRMKFLTTGAYYTSEPGIQELGYVGNEAMAGDYPGPTPEALAHLDRVLATLNLSTKGNRP
jgi:hypothetical protein